MTTPRTEGSVLLETAGGVIAIELYWAHAPRTCQVRTKRREEALELTVVPLPELFRVGGEGLL